MNVRNWVPFRVCSRTLLASDGDIGEPSDVSVPLAPEDDLPLLRSDTIFGCVK